LAALVGVPALPVFCWRTGFFDYRLRVCPPLRPVSGNPESLAAALDAFAGLLEQVTLEHPTQWFHFLH
jgi:lauroyl/myristoyl acyltransferase